MLASMLTGLYSSLIIAISAPFAVMAPCLTQASAGLTCPSDLAVIATPQSG
jgi:hypothetical protein